jgi:hypothetical protein
MPRPHSHTCLTSHIDGESCDVLSDPLFLEVLEASMSNIPQYLSSQAAGWALYAVKHYEEGVGIHSPLA